MAQRRSIFSSRTARAALPYSDQPEWEVIGPAIRLGYRRGRSTSGRGGSWLAATRLPDGSRKQVRLGLADDGATANGTDILDHEQAKAAARSWVKAAQTREPIAVQLTVNQVLDKYLAAREAEGMKSVDDCRRRAAFHIRPKLGQLVLSQLTAERLRNWRDGMVTAEKRLRTARYADRPNVRVVDLKDPDTLRRRRDTANRTLTTLKAALNWAFQNRLVVDDHAWRLVKPFRATGASRIRFLTDVEQRKLMAASNGAIRGLVAAALVTGARFGELARLQVRDFDANNGTLFVAESKSGKPRHVPLPAGGVELFKSLVLDRPPEARMLVKEDGEHWGTSSYNRPWKALLKRAELPDMTLHELRHTYASTMVRNGAPLMVVAHALGHADTRMAEKHYAHLAPSYVADTIRRLAPDIGSVL